MCFYGVVKCLTVTNNGESRVGFAGWFGNTKTTLFLSASGYKKTIPDFHVEMLMFFSAAL
jgi:hypothetical protein